MRRFLRYDRSAALSPLSYEDAAIHIRAYVAMATVDGDVRTGELECLVELVDALGTPDSRGRLLSLLRMLLETPPFTEDVLDDLVHLAHRVRRAPALLRGLDRVAKADGRISVRELAFEAAAMEALAGTTRPLARIV